MPKLEDLYHILEQDPKTKTLKTKLIPFVKGSLKFFNEYTNIEVDQNLIVADIYELRRRQPKIWYVCFHGIFLGCHKNRPKPKKSYLP